MNSLQTMTASALNWFIGKVVSTEGSKEMEEVFKGRDKGEVGGASTSPRIRT